MNLPPLPESQAHRWRVKGSGFGWIYEHGLSANRPLTETEELFTAEQVRQAQRDAVAAAVPDGWKMVPIDPTDEMIQAADDGDREYTLRNFGDIQTVQSGPYDHWCAMIAAAPGGER